MFPSHLFKVDTCSYILKISAGTQAEIVLLIKKHVLAIKSLLKLFLKLHPATCTYIYLSELGHVSFLSVWYANPENVCFLNLSRFSLPSQIRVLWFRERGRMDTGGVADILFHHNFYWVSAVIGSRGHGLLWPLWRERVGFLILNLQLNVQGNVKGFEGSELSESIRSNPCHSSHEQSEWYFTKQISRPHTQKRKRYKIKEKDRSL